MRAMRVLPLLAAALLLSRSEALAHCEIPCGIYDDGARFTLIEEHITTIAKSMRQIDELSAAERSAVNANQLVRWTTNKEQHADEIRHIIVQYFLAQRIIAPDAGDAAAMEAYTEQLMLTHQILRTAMKCKQTVDTALTDKLQALAHDFRHAYGAARK